MKRLLITLALVLALALPAGAATCYCDYATGNDSTGDGSYGTPYQTIDGCEIGMSLTGAGDEIRVAKTTVTALSGTLTFTKESTSVSTSADLTGELATGNFITASTDLDITDKEGIYYVASVTSDTVTLGDEYASASGAKSCVKINEYDFQGNGHNIEDISAGTDGTDGNPFKITGGWDLTTQTRDGYSFFNGNNSLSCFSGFKRS